MCGEVRAKRPPAAAWAWVPDWLQFAAFVQRGGKGSDSGELQYHYHLGHKNLQLCMLANLGDYLLLLAVNGQLRIGSWLEEGPSAYFWKYLFSAPTMNGGLQDDHLAPATQSDRIKDLYGEAGLPKPDQPLHFLRHAGSNDHHALLGSQLIQEIGKWNRRHTTDGPALSQVPRASLRNASPS